MKTFTGIPYYHYWENYNQSCLAARIAEYLLNNGVEDVSMGPHFIAGHKDLGHFDIWWTGLECAPGIKVLYKGRETSLLMAICKSLKLNCCGSYSDTHMQVSIHDNNVTHRHLIDNMSIEQFFSRIYIYFCEMRKFKI